MKQYIVALILLSGFDAIAMDFDVSGKSKGTIIRATAQQLLPSMKIISAQSIGTLFNNKSRIKWQEYQQWANSDKSSNDYFLSTQTIVTCGIMISSCASFLYTTYVQYHQPAINIEPKPSTQKLDMRKKACAITYALRLLKSMQAEKDNHLALLYVKKELDQEAWYEPRTYNEKELQDFAQAILDDKRFMRFLRSKK